MWVPSEARPIDSRSSIAGSSARMPLTISILFDDSHLGICEAGEQKGG